MGWLATHHELYGFIIFHQKWFQIQSQDKIFLEVCPQTLSKNMPSKMLSVVCTLYMWARPTQPNPHFKFWCYIILVICIWKTQLSWNLNQPPTLIYFWISACIDFKLKFLVISEVIQMHIAYFMPAADERLRYISGEWGRYLERVTSVIQL